MTSELDEVRGLFLRFVEGQNARDEAVVSAMLRPGPTFLWVTTSAVTVWGHDATMDRFRSNWRQQWKLDPDMAALEIVKVGSDTAMLHVPLMFTFGPHDTDVVPVPIKWSGVFLRLPEGWCIVAILLATVP